MRGEKHSGAPPTRAVFVPRSSPPLASVPSVHLERCRARPVRSSFGGRRCIEPAGQRGAAPRADRDAIEPRERQNAHVTRRPTVWVTTRSVVADPPPQRPPGWPMPATSRLAYSWIRVGETVGPSLVAHRCASHLCSHRPRCARRSAPATAPRRPPGPRSLDRRRSPCSRAERPGRCQVCARASVAGLPRDTDATSSRDALFRCG